MRSKWCQPFAWIGAASLLWVAGYAVPWEETARADPHPHIDRPACVSVIVPPGNTAVSGGDSNKVTLWDLTKDPPVSLGDYKKTHQKKVSYVAVSLNGVGNVRDKLYQASFDGDVVVSKLDVNAGDPGIKEFKGHTKPLAPPGAAMEVWVVAPSPDGKYAASATNFGEIKLWETETPNPAQARGTVAGSMTTFNPVGGLVFLPKPATGNQRFVAGHYDGTARVYEMVPIGATGNFNLTNTIIFNTGVSAAVNSVAITTDGKKLVTSGFDDEIRVWDLPVAAGPPPANPVTINNPLVEITDHADIVWRVAVSPNNDKIASASEDGTVRVFGIDGHALKDNGNNTAVLTDPDPDTHGFMGVAFQTNNKVVYTAGNHKKEHVRVWDITAFK